MILVCTDDDFRKNLKIRKISVCFFLFLFFLNHNKTAIGKTAKCQVFDVFQVSYTGS